MAQIQILITEDETTLTKEIENKLENIGHTVLTTASTSIEATQKAVDTHPDLILIDIKLKDNVDDITPVGQAQDRYDIPVIYLAAFADMHLLQQAKITEPFGYLIEPFAERELQTAIEMALYKQRMRKKLRESEAHYRSLFDGVPVALYRTTPQGDIVDANPAMVQMLGYPDRESLLAINVTDTIVIPEKRKQWQDLIERENIVHGFEIQIRQKDGNIIWVEDNARAVQDINGQVLYYEGTLKEITEHKQAEQALQDNIQELKIAYQQAIIYAQELTGEITERRRAEAEIRKLNEELEHRVADRTRDLSVLYEVTMVASESLELGTMLERSLEQVLATIKRNVGTIHLVDEEAEILHLAVYQGVPIHIAAEIKTMPFDDELVGWIIEHREPVLIPDMTTDSRIPWSARNTKEVYTYLGLPMRARGRVLGILSILGEKEQQFNAEEVALLASVADQVGVAVENARLRQQAERAAVIEERERLARELHDSVTQSLYSLSLFAEAGESLVEIGDLEAVKHNLKRMGETAQQALKEMRLLVYELRPLDLEKEGLIGALHQRLSAVEGRVNIKARLVAEELVELPAPVEEELYRIAQEALNNALKHAATTSVTIYLRVEGDQVELEVVDDGKGFDPNAASDTGGLGLISMQERAEKLNGSLAIHSIPGEGTRVKVSVKTGQNM